MFLCKVGLKLWMDVKLLCKYLNLKSFTLKQHFLQFSTTILTSLNYSGGLFFDNLTVKEGNVYLLYKNAKK